MNKNKSFWDFLDLKTTKEVKKYINQDKEFITNTQYSRFNLACHFCKRNEENLFKYLIKNNICKVPTMKASCELDNCNSFCEILVINGKTTKQIKEEDFKKFKELIEKIIKEHKEELDKLA